MTGVGVMRTGTGVPTVAGASTTVLDGSGLVMSVTDPRGMTSTLARDAGGRVVSARDPDARVTATTYDRDSRVTTSTSGSGTGSAATTTYRFDVPAGATTGAPGSLVTCPTMVPAAGPSGAGVAAVTVKWCQGRTDAMGGTSLTVFDTTGVAVASITPSGKVTRTGFDLAGRPVVTVNPDGTSSTVTYDAAGRVLSKVSSSGSPAPVSYTYTTDGLLASMRDTPAAGGSVTGSVYGYDAIGRLVSTSRATWTSSDAAPTPVAGTGVGYGRDLSGNVTSVTYPDGRVVTRTVDALGVSAVADGQRTTAGGPAPNVTGLTRNLDGNVTGLTPTVSGAASPAGGVSFGYDQGGAMTSVTATDAPTGGTGGTVLAGLSWGTRSGAGLVVSETGSGTSGAGLGGFGFVDV